MQRWKLFLREEFVPKVFFDIGANNPFAEEGQQVVMAPLMPETGFYLFEAMSKHEESLKNTGYPYAIAVLGDKDGKEVTFYETKAKESGPGDSYYKEQTGFYDDDNVVATVHEMVTLDTLVREKNWPLPDFIKLDTQGSELDILKGAKDCMKKVKGLQLECALDDYNKGAPQFAEVISFAETSGFKLYDILQYHTDDLGRLIQLDLLFVRK
jgi:FkbM family methyltransferase